MPHEIESFSESGAPFRLGDWRVEPSLNRLSRAGTTAQLEPKAMDVLLCLADRAGEAVGKRELLDAVWQAEFVADNTLARRIADLREALGDDARNPRYIETIPKRGYRLIAEVSLDGGPSNAAQQAGLHQAEADEGSPYPGLAPFTEEDAGVFFGREAEVAALWRRIAGRRLLAVIGPSGAGKSSLLRAGVVARAPPGWRALVCQPSEEPFLAVARALATDLVDDAAEMRQLLAFHEPDIALAVTSRWRARWGEALLVVDQFEELFTLCPEALRDRFVALLRRLVDAAGIHVVLVLRDDFLLECHRHRELAPIFTELTPVGPPPTDQLKRALTEPASRHLYGFESDLLVEEMVAEIEGERGALPLLAFAVSRLWELRDRERRLLTREAYEEIGSVGGALARHADATLEAIGRDRLPLVRELFRNLVTAQATRATRSVDDLLSVFPEGERDSARQVLETLVDARLLTTFEQEVEENAAVGGPRRVEIVHESLLKAWPRLVRWQTQDADAAQLRDQLRQTAQLWQARGRPNDLLWTGASYREFYLWRERYPGGLTAAESSFVEAMTGHAFRRRRRRRILSTGLVTGLAVVAVALAGLWQRSQYHARRVEARRLTELSRQAMDRSPPEAFAHALASLEIMDSHQARRLTMEALWSSPMPMVIGRDHRPSLFVGVDFSPNGDWLSVGHFAGHLTLWPRAGGAPESWRPHMGATRGYFLDDTKLFTACAADLRAVVWSVSDHAPLGSEDLRITRRQQVDSRHGNIFFQVLRMVQDSSQQSGWRLDQRALQLCEQLAEGYFPAAAMSPGGGFIAVARGDALLRYDLDRPTSTATRLATCTSPADVMEYHPDGTRLATAHTDGTMRLWSLVGSEAAVQREWPRPLTGGCNHLRFDTSGTLLTAAYDTGTAVLRGIDDVPGSDAQLLEMTRSRMLEASFSPDGRWLATANMNRVGLWPLHRARRPTVLRGHAGSVEALAFAPDGSWLVSYGNDGTVRRWPLVATPGAEPTVLFDWGHPVERGVGWLDLSADGRFVVTAGSEDSARLVPMDGSPVRTLGGSDMRVLRVAVGAGGRLVAMPGRSRGKMVIFLWDLETESVSSIGLGEGGPELMDWYANVEVLPDGRLLTAYQRQLRIIDPVTGARTTVGEEVANDAGVSFSVAAEGTLILTNGPKSVRPRVCMVHDLEAGTSTRLKSHGDRATGLALDASGTIAVTTSDGIVRVGPTNGEAPHWLVGHQGGVNAAAVSPDGRFIATGGTDGTIRLWPMPDLKKLPLHDLPRAELLARLRALTNLRVERDPDDPEGYAVTVGDFPGWQVAPRW